MASCSSRLDEEESVDDFSDLLLVDCETYEARIPELREDTGLELFFM